MSERQTDLIGEKHRSGNDYGDYDEKDERDHERRRPQLGGPAASFGALRHYLFIAFIPGNDTQAQPDDRQTDEERRHAGTAR